MKIVHFVPGLDDPTCGVAVAARLVAAQQREDGFETDIFYLPMTRIRDVPFDVYEIWVHSMWSPCVMRAAWQYRSTTARLVRMPHGCTDPVKLAHHAFRKRLAAVLERRLFRYAGKIAVTSEAEKAWMESFLGPEHAPFFFVDLTRNLQAPRFPPPRLEKLLYIGRLHPLKGVEYLVRAMHRTQSLVVIGKDEGEGSKIMRIARRRGLDVRYLGIAPKEVKAAELAACDALVLPTLSENFALVVSEALAAGKPVITTDGAPFWKDRAGVKYLDGFVAASGQSRVEMLEDALRQ